MENLPLSPSSDRHTIGASAAAALAALACACLRSPAWQDHPRLQVLFVAVHLKHCCEACSHECPTAGAAHAAVSEQLDKIPPASPNPFGEDECFLHFKPSPSGGDPPGAADPTAAQDLEQAAVDTTLGEAITTVAEERTRDFDCLILIPGVTQRASSTPSCGSHSSLHPNAMLWSSAHRTSLRVRC